MKNWIKNLKVRNKILLIISINVFFTALMTIISHQSLNKVDDIKADIVQVGTAASRQLLADMMHDALRADVYNAFLTESKDTKGKVEVKKDFAEHVGIFNTSLNELKHLKVDQKIITQVNKIRGPLDAYIRSSKGLINKALYTSFELHSSFGQKEIHAYKLVFDNLAVEMENLNENIEKEYTHQQDVLTDYTHQVQWVLFLLGLIVAIIALTLSLFVSKLIEKPVLLTEEVLGKISSGVLTDRIEVEGKDETANMLRSLNSVVENLSNVKTYVTEVGKGNFETDIEIFQNNGEIYESLHAMTDAIKANVEEDKKRNWTSEGLAKFVEYTRDIQDVEMFYNNILSNLIRYIHANQGYLYVINDDNQDDIFMEIKAVYAYGKQRYLEEKKEIRYKQGLVGQSWFDKEPLYFTEIPADFVTITSGIGEATPRCVFIVPLMVNEKVLGVLEIASFEPMLDYQKDFVTKLSETIASTVDSAKTNERTRKLLIASQHAEQAMKSQEEEIRQNMEEMSATQAEMERVQRSMVLEKQRIEDEFEAQLNIINNVAIVSKTDVQGNITYVNENFLKWAKYTKEEVMGKNHRMLKSGDQDDAIFEEMWKTISSGKVFRGEIKNKAKDGSFYWVDAIIAPVLDKQGKPKEYIAQRFVINEQKLKEQEMQEMLEETRAQEEEIRQNMEEMAATQEQMERQNLAIAQNAVQQKGIIDGINATMATIEFTPEGNVVTANDNFLQTMKCSLKDIFGKHHKTFVPQDIQQSEDYATFWKRLAAGIDNKGVFKRINTEGNIVWLDAIYNPIFDKDGKVTKVMKFATDITKKVELEAENKAQLDIINEIAIVSKTDLKGDITYVNEEFLKWAKYSREEVMGKNHRMLKSGDQEDQIFVDMWKTISSGKIFRGEIKNKAKDGSIYWVDAIIAPILDENGKPKEYIAQRFVINEQKLKEQEMQEMLEETRAQEEEIRQNMEEMAATQEQMERQNLAIAQNAVQQKGIIDGINATMATIEFTPEGNVVTANDNFLQTMKCSLKDIFGKHHKTFVPQDIQQSEDYATFWKRLAAGIENKGVFKRINTEGNIVWLDAIYNPIFDKDGKVTKVMKFATDITKRVELEAENKAQIDIINEIAIVSKTDLKGDIIYVNEEFLKWSKYTIHEVLGKNHRMLKSGDQDDKIFDEMWKKISSGKIFRGEIKNKAKDGSFYWVDAIVAPILDEHGKPKEYIAQRFVINEQKEKEQEMQAMLEETRAQEEEIRQSMEEMTAIQEQMERAQREIQTQTNIINSIAIVSKTDAQGNITYVNEEFLKWSKYTEEEVMGKNHRILKSGDQDDQIFVDMWKTISSGKIFRGEIKNKAKDGSIYWVDAIIAPVLDNAGKPKEYIAQRFVINDQKEREAKLNELLGKK